MVPLGRCVPVEALACLVPCTLHAARGMGARWLLTPAFNDPRSPPIARLSTFPQRRARLPRRQTWWRARACCTRACGAASTSWASPWAPRPPAAAATRWPRTGRRRRRRAARTRATSSELLCLPAWVLDWQAGWQAGRAAVQAAPTAFALTNRPPPKLPAGASSTACWACAWAARTCCSTTSTPLWQQRSGRRKPRARWVGAGLGGWRGEWLEWL